MLSPGKHCSGSETAGEFLNWHPHLHVLAPAGAFRTDGSFAHSPRLCCRRPAGPVPGQRPGFAAQGTDDLARTGRTDERMATLRGFMLTQARRIPTSRMRCAWGFTWSGGPPQPVASALILPRNRKCGTLPREPSPITEKSGCPPATGTTTTWSGSPASPRTF